MITKKKLAIFERNSGSIDAFLKWGASNDLTDEDCSLISNICMRLHIEKLSTDEFNKETLRIIKEQFEEGLLIELKKLVNDGKF